MKGIYLFLILLFINNIYSAPDPNFYIFLCFGQSNMEGNGPIEEIDLQNVPERFQTLASVDMPAEQRSKHNWYKATPPLCRSWNMLNVVDYFGRHLVENLPEKIRIGVITVAVGGSKIIMWQEEKLEEYLKHLEEWQVPILETYGNNPYKTLMDAAKEAQKSGVIKGILLHQGEADTGDEEWPNNVKIVYDRMINELGLKAEEVPLLAGEVVTQEMMGCCWQHNAIIAKLPEVIPNAHVISAKDLPHKGDTAHFSSESYRKFGRRYAEKMLTLFPKEKDEKGGLSKGAIAAIMIIIILLLGGAGFFVYWKFFKKSEEIAPTKFELFNKNIKDI